MLLIDLYEDNNSGFPLLTVCFHRAKFFFDGFVFTLHYCVIPHSLYVSLALFQLLPPASFGSFSFLIGRWPAKINFAYIKSDAIETLGTSMDLRMSASRTLKGSSSMVDSSAHSHKVSLEGELGFFQSESANHHKTL